ncbi:MAG: vanadium-dependent haloperoxidase [Ferruginibacter sp.]
MKNIEAVEAAKTYALTRIAMYDVIITCWKEKFRSQVIRPITVINETIDRSWLPFLQTPPFPEHSSGHSGISAAAAAILTKRFGDNFAFNDTTELRYIGMKRSFTSFEQAAQEASMSRIYGGIHYRSGVNAGVIQGKSIAEYVYKKLF